MKATMSLEKRGRVGLCCREGFKCLATAIDVIRRRRPGGALRQLALDDPAKLIDTGQILEPDVSRVRRALRRGDHQRLGLQSPQCLPDGHNAHRKALGDILRKDPLAWRDRAREQLTAQLVGHRLRCTRAQVHAPPSRAYIVHG